MKVKVTRAGMTSCPSCLSHFNVGEDLQAAQCPFCGEQLKAAFRAEPGSAAMSLISRSRSGLLMAALAGGLMFSACGDNNDNTKEPADAGTDALVQDDVFEDPNNQDYALAPVKDQQPSG